MPSRSEAAELRLVLFKAALLLLAIAINGLEFLFPRIPFLPWLKPGLANTITIVWILRFGTADALVYSLIRIWVVGFYFGFSLVTLLLALSGGLLATLAMGLAWWLLGRRGLLGLVGVGIVGAFFHNAGQLIVVYLLLAHNALIFYQFPFMAAASVVFGGLVGLVAAWCYTRLTDEKLGDAGDAGGLVTPQRPRLRWVLLSSALLVAAMVPAFVRGQTALLAGAIGVTLAVQVVKRLSVRALFYPITRFWLLFLFVAGVHLFMSYGRPFPGVPLVTHEGLAEAIIQGLRLWIWLQLSQLLPHVKFDAVFFSLLSRLFPGHRSTLLAGLLSLEYFPDVLARAQRRAVSGFAQLLRSPRRAAQDVIGGLYGEILERLMRSGDSGVREGK